MVVIARKNKQIEEMKRKLQIMTGCHGHSHAVDTSHEDAAHGPAHATAAEVNASAASASTAEDGENVKSKEAANGLVL